MEAAPCGPPFSDLTMRSGEAVTTFCLMRHGETYWNVERRMQGQVNIPLNEHGIAQAQQARERLKDVAFDICYSSPLSRSLETARTVLSGRDVPVVVSNLLVEQGYGLAEGLRVDAILDKPEHPAYGYDFEPENYKGAIGSESFEDLFNRMGRVVAELMVPATRQYENVLLSAHGAVACGLVDLLLGYPIGRFWDTKLENCGVAIIESEDDGFRVIDAPSLGGRKRIATW